MDLDDAESVDSVQIILPIWDKLKVRNAMRHLGEFIRTSPIRGRVSIDDDGGSSSIFLKARDRGAGRSLFQARDLLRKAVLEIGIDSGNVIVHPYNDSSGRRTSSSGVNSNEKTLSAMQAQIIDLREQLVGKMNEIGELQTYQADLEARLVSANAPISRRGDLHILESVRLGRVKELAETSRAYADAERDFKYEEGKDHNQQLIDAARASRSDFEKTEFYAQNSKLIEKAREAIVRAENDPFVNVERAKNLLAEVEAKKTEHDNKKQNTEKIRAALDGKRVLYQVISEEDGENYKISVVMPIQYQEDMKNHSALELDLIAHVHDQWNTLRSDTPIKGFKREGRLGVVAYNYFIPRTGMSPEKIRAVEDKIVNALFNSQRDYAFGAFGLRVDLEKITSTAGQRLEGEVYSSEPRAVADDAPKKRERTSAEKATITRPEGMKFGGTTSLEYGGGITAEQVDVRVSESLAAIDRNVNYQGLPNISGWGRSTRSQALVMGAIRILAESGRTFSSQELLEALKKVIPELDNYLGNEVANNNLRIGLIHFNKKFGMLEFIKDPATRRVSYKIKEQYRRQ